MRGATTVPDRQNLAGCASQPSVRRTPEYNTWRRQHQPHRRILCSARSPSSKETTLEVDTGLLSRSELLRGGIAGMAGTWFSGWFSPPQAHSDDKSCFPPPQVGQVVMRTLRDSALAVSIYPTFQYNALGGGGTAQCHPVEDGKLHLTFDPDQLIIPAVSWRNTTFMGVPMAPPFKITIAPQKLEGFVNKTTGEAQLQFNAEFVLTAGPLYTAPPLIVSTLLTTEHAAGDIHQEDGSRVNKDGYAKLAGVARVERTGDRLLDSFLRLPNETVAVMSSQFVFPSTTA